MNFKIAFRFLVLACLVGSTSLLGGVYFHSVPGSVQDGQSYMVGATFYPPYGGGGDLSIYKNSSWIDGNSDYGSFSTETWTSDSGPATVDFMAEGIDWDIWSPEYDYAQVTVSGTANQSPVATVEVDGHRSGATITRPNGGSVTVTVRYKATDANGNLTGIRPQVWSPDGYLNNNGAQFIAQSGAYGEVVWTVTLNQDGDWYFWTDACDSIIAPNYVDSGSWGSGFQLHVVPAPPPNSPPIASVWANASSLYTGQTAQIYVRGQDSDGNARYFNLDQISPLNCFYGPGDNFTSSQQPNNGWWDLGSTSGDYTRTVNMTFDRPGTYVWRGAVMDSAGSGCQYSPTNHTITVPNRDPSVSIQILDSAQNVIGLDGNGRARIPSNTTFYIQVSGADPDGRLLRLYSRVNNAAGSGYAYEQHDVSGGSATWTFGPYNTGTSVGVWDVWGHAEDQDNGGYQWQGGGWWGTQSPDIEVYQPNNAPTGSWQTLPPASVSYGMNIIARATGSDSDGNLTSVWVDSSVNGGAWTALAYNGGGNGFTNTSDANIVTVGAPGTTYAFRYYVADAAGANTGWVTSGTYTSVKTTPSGGFASRTIGLTGATYTVAASDLNATFTNPFPGQVSAPSGAATYSVVGPGTLVQVGTQLGAGTYTIRATYPGDGNYNATTVDATWTLSAAPTYTLTVENGSGSGAGLYVGSVQNIAANSPPVGQQFNGWTVVAGPGTLGNAAATSTTFTVGSGNATVRANFGLTPNGDADGDGMPNSWESTYGLNPNSPADAGGDPDGDGVSNLAEYLLGTNPSTAKQDDSGNSTQLRVQRPRS